MNPIQFFKLVSEMRRCQKEYFKNRSREALQQSKALEKRVDGEIARVSEVMRRKNPSFFEE